jgi:NMD protein affecting ribosome stability and mRNA decay
VRAVRSPVPAGHVECARCSALTPAPVAVLLCADCFATVSQAAERLELARAAQRARLAGGERWVTAEEAAGALGCTPHHVRRLIRRRILPERRVRARVWTSERAVQQLVRERPDRAGPAA